MKGTEHFTRTIAEYLNQRAMADPLFAPNPSLTGIIIFHKFSVCFEGFMFAKYLIISRSVF